MGWSNPPVPWQEFARRSTWGGPPAAPAPVTEPEREPDGFSPGPVEWAELHCHTSFSFLDGATEPARLVAEAAGLGVRYVAVTDHDGMYGAVQFADAIRAHPGMRGVYGAELSMALPGPQTGEPDPAGWHLLVLARGQEGYRRLCKAITKAQLDGGEKGRPDYDLETLAAEHGGHWAILTGCRKGPLANGVPLERLAELFGKENVHVELIDHDHPGDDPRNDALYAEAIAKGFTVVASNNVHYAAPGEDARLAQALAAIRARRSLDTMEGWLPASGTAHVRSGEEMAERLARFPGVREATVALAEACWFDFKADPPGLPACDVPEGHTEASYLRELTYEGAVERYGPRDAERTPGAWAQIDRELEVIERLNFPGYFLIVYDIVRFCRDNGILCQGRGSAANSAACYALGITGVDAVHHKLLFERFLSPGRDGPPDIDLDIEHKRREEAIQHIYDKYGRECTAQVANVISYRPKMATRDAARALGYSPGQQDAWSKQVDWRDPVNMDEIPAGVTRLAERMSRLPRHLGIHSGGMVICERPVGEVCPIEWARKEKRSVLQWDKDDCASAGLVKFDLLGLGMLSALADCFRLVASYGEAHDLSNLPQDDPDVYDMLCDADTVGVFQVESRAQMATLPRLRPRTFYDLVVEVALIRPGPIQGGSVHPYIRRRQSKEPPAIPHPTMARALSRTLGVPLFQEQMMQLAVDCAGFTPQESDALRQAMSSKRAPERIERLRARLLDGMAERGIPLEVSLEVYDKILGFSSFGFPESHAQSFAHLVYASAWLKRHHPAAFTASLLRNQPMGFYSPQSLLGDAKRHGVTVLPLDVNASKTQAELEGRFPLTRDHPHTSRGEQPGIRLGLDLVRDLSDDTAEAIVAGGPYTSLEDLALKVPLSAAAFEALATAGAFDSLGVPRREAVWTAGALAGTHPGHLPGTAPGATAPALPPLSFQEETLADLWSTGVSATHPLAHLRPILTDQGVLRAEDLKTAPPDTNVVVAGLVTHRQRPPTAGGIVFLSLEDETGTSNIICPPAVWSRHRAVGLNSQGLLIHGRLESRENVRHVHATKLSRLPVPGRSRSRDFH